MKNLENLQGKSYESITGISTKDDCCDDFYPSGIIFNLACLLGGGVMINLENIKVWKDDFLYDDQWTIKATIYDDCVYWYCTDCKHNGEYIMFSYIHDVIDHIKRQSFI